MPTTVADAVWPLVEPGYLAARARPHDELARRLARDEREVPGGASCTEQAEARTRGWRGARCGARWGSLAAFSG